MYIHEPPNSCVYRADLMESAEMIECLCQFQPVWSQQLTAWKATKSHRYNTTQMYMHAHVYLCTIEILCVND